MTVQRICARHGRFLGSTCPECRRERAGRPKRNTLAVQVRSSRRWKRVERAARERDGGRCTYGLQIGERGAGHYPDGRCPVTEGLSGHHVVPIEDGGAPYDLDNVRTLCAPHHARKEAEIRREKEEQHGEEASD